MILPQPEEQRGSTCWHGTWAWPMGWTGGAPAPPAQTAHLSWQLTWVLHARLPRQRRGNSTGWMAGLAQTEQAVVDVSAVTGIERSVTLPEEWLPTPASPAAGVPPLHHALSARRDRRSFSYSSSLPGRGEAQMNREGQAETEIWKLSQLSRFLLWDPFIVTYNCISPKNLLKFSQNKSP